MQPIEEMQWVMTKAEFQGFLKGNMIKYLRRAEYKGTKEADVHKAQQYAYWLKLSEDGEKIDPRKHIYTGTEPLSKYYYSTVYNKE